MIESNKIIQKIENVIIFILKIICVSMLLLIMLMVTANIFVRFVPIFSLHWLDEIFELSFAYLIFYGSAAAWISKEHFKVGDMISSRLPNDRMRALYKLIIELLSMVFIIILFYYSLQLSTRSLELTAYFSIPKSLVYSCMPVSTGIMLLASIKNVIQKIINIIAVKQ